MLRTIGQVRLIDDIDMDEQILKFKNRKIKAKKLFVIKEIEKKVAYEFIAKYHYLKDAKFFSIYNYGLYLDCVLVGCATFSNPQGIQSLNSWFGLSNSDQTVLELSRLCMLPKLNGTNATSYLLGNSIKMLKQHGIRAVITLADDSRHVGSIYQICNFKYYGLTSKQKDFYRIDGKKNARGKTKNKNGVWLPRTQKHRYAFLIDKNLQILLTEQKRPTYGKLKKYECCYGTKIVFDNRFNKYYTCPICTNELIPIEKEN